jgi:predicted amidophosphoribosyltransferase
MTEERICPTCLRPYKPNDQDRRVCAKCGNPILKHDKYRFVKSAVEHRNCDNPTAYH